MAQIYRIVQVEYKGEEKDMREEEGEIFEGMGKDRILWIFKS